MKRKAISPVLATVVLIAMTMISAIAVSGFMFGLFSDYATTAQVQAQYSSCTGAGATCTVLIFNSGNSNTNIYTGASCASLTYGGTTVFASTCSGPAGATQVAAGGSLAVTITFPSSFAQPTGTRLTGSVHTSSGAQALFSGQFN